jgi:hypothetical protein
MARKQVKTRTTRLTSRLGKEDHKAVILRDGYRGIEHERATAARRLAALERQEQRLAAEAAEELRTTAAAQFTKLSAAAERYAGAAKLDFSLDVRVELIALPADEPAQYAAILVTCFRETDGPVQTVECRRVFLQPERTRLKLARVDAIRAECEQLRGKIARCEMLLGDPIRMELEATARVADLYSGTTSTSELVGDLLDITFQR